MKKINSLVIAAFCAHLLGGFITTGKAQTFAFQYLADSVSYGQPAGNDIVVEGNIINESSTDIEIDIIRRENNLPSGWESYLCSDVCLASFMDSTRLYLPGSQTQNFKLSFITTNVIDTGNCLIVFKNVSNGANIIQKRMFGITDLAAGITNTDLQENGFTIFPNPAGDKVNVTTNKQILHADCYNAEGKKIKVTMQKNQSGCMMDVSELPPGIYFLKASTADGMLPSRKFIKE